MSYECVSQDTLFWLVASQKAAVAAAAAAARQKPRTKASLSRLEYASRAEEKTDGDEIVKLSGKAYPPFAISKALFCCFQDVNYLLGSAARGRSSCNNTEHADNKAFMAQFLQWNGNFFFLFFFW